MRKRNKIRYSITIFCFIIIFGLNIFAEGKTTEAYIEPDISDYFLHRVEDNTIKINLSNQNLDRLKKELKSYDQTEDEIYTSIYKELGYTDAEIESIGLEEITSTMKSSSEITVNIQYVKITKNGNMIIMEKDQCLKEAAAKQQLELQKSQIQEVFDPVDMNTVNGDSSFQIYPYETGGEDIENKQIETKYASNDDYEYIDESEDGYMKIITRCDYLPCYRGDEKGWYMFSSTFTWLKQPTYKMTDAMSLFVNNVAWSPDSFYSSYHFEAQFLYSDPGVLGGASWVPISSTETQTDPTFEPTGIYFTWPLSPYGNDNRYLFLSRTFYIRGIARISQYNQEYAGNFYSKYQHVHSVFNIQPSFSWSTGGIPGVTITGAWLDDYTTYSSLCYFSYDPNRHYSH